MAPKGKSVEAGTQFVRIKVAACQYAKYEFECVSNIICLVTRLPQLVNRSVLRRNAAVLTVADVWEAMKQDRQKIKLDLDDGGLKLTTDADRTVPLENNHELHEANTCLALGYPKAQPSKKKTTGAASSSSTVEADQTLENPEPKKDYPTKLTKTGVKVIVEFRSQDEAEKGLKDLVEFYDMEDTMNAAILEQIEKLKAMLVKKGPTAAAAAAAATTEDDDDEEEEEEELEEKADESEK